MALNPMDSRTWERGTARTRCFGAENVKNPDVIDRDPGASVEAAAARRQMSNR